MSILAKENNDMHWKSGFEVFNAFGSIREKCYWSDIWIIMMIYLKLGLESKSIQNEDDVIDMTSEGTWVPYYLFTENAEHRIWHYCTPLQIVCQKPNVENYNEAL